ncbi:MAG: serine/threonine protein kinase [Myxococcaceae bacterium]|nr:serine/threonine protein kinase [Myxococcaceae bacterium]
MPCPHTPSGPCSLCDPVDPAVATYISEARPAQPTGIPPEGLDFGARVNRYVVHDLLGRGGMGLVYTAHDPDLGRWVAIKLLRNNARNDEDLSRGQARLMREAQAMAQLSHPNVMPVYDVGHYEGTIFIAMELVRGLTLGNWVKAAPRTWREVLAMFLQAGRGIEAAHAAGLIHRDFKPANVLIGDDGRPRVTDFGIARSVRGEADRPPPSETPESWPTPSSSSSLEAPLTREGALMGSPGYMAPEQYAGLAASPASDQFAFCVALYEALYGKRPFAGATLAELAHATTLGHVPPAPKGSTVPVWLHRVLERGLKPDAAARHPSMTALLQALSDDPGEKLRNRLVAGAVVLLVVASGAAAVLSQVEQGRACRGAERLLNGVWDDTARAKAKTAFEATGKSYATLAFEHARTEMDAYARAWANARTEACEATRVRGEQSEAIMGARFECLERRRDELSALAQAYASADVETVDRAYGAASRLSDLGTCKTARADRKQPPPEAKEAAAQLGHELAQGRSLVSAGRFDAARERISSALQISRALKLPAQQAECGLALGELERDTKRFQAARAALQDAVRQAEAAGDDELAARALTLLVTVVGWRLERPDEARSFALIATGKLDRLGGNPRIEASLAEALGDAEWQAGNRAASLAAYQKALAGFTALEGEEGLSVARLHSSLGWVLTEQGSLSEARVELNTSLKTREKLLGAEHPTLISSWNELSTLALAMGDVPEAVRTQERALELARKSLGNDSPAVARMALNLSQALVPAGRVAEADTLVESARELLDRHPDAPVSLQVEWVRQRGQVDAALSRFAVAEQHARDGLTKAVSAFGEKHPQAALFHLDLARALSGQKKWRDALVEYDTFARLEEGLGAGAEPETVLALAESGGVLVELKRGAEALERLEQAVRLLPLDKGNHARAGHARLLLAQALWPTEPARAKTVALEARGEFELAKRDADVKRVDVWLKGK